MKSWPPWFLLTLSGMYGLFAVMDVAADELSFWTVAWVLGCGLFWRYYWRARSRLENRRGEG